MIAPSRKQTGTENDSLRSSVISLPTPSPFGIIDMSAPSEKKPIPTISSTAPPRNISSVSPGIGTTNALSAITSSVMGMTEASDSMIVPFSLFNGPASSDTISRLKS